MAILFQANLMIEGQCDQGEQFVLPPLNRRAPSLT
jgi:hypothetical protein